MTLDRSIPFVACVLVVIGCGGGEGIFRKDGFYNDRHPYRVSYSEAGSAPLARSGWIVDNYEIDDGEFGDEKETPGYRTHVRLDGDADGIADTELSLSAYDLLLRNAKHAGRIWVRTLPIARDMQQMDLRVLALDFIDAVGVSGRYTTDLRAAQAQRRRRLATRVLDGFAVKLNGSDAYEIAFESADVDQVRFGDAGRYWRTRLIVLRPDFGFASDEGRFPSLMLVGYTNRAEDFARGSADFERFVGGVDVLSEHELVESRSKDIFECLDDDPPAVSVFLVVDGRGRIEWADTERAKGAVAFDRLPDEPCVQRALGGLRLRDKGWRRKLTVTLQRMASAQPAGGYVRVPPAAASPVLSAK